VLILCNAQSIEYCDAKICLQSPGIGALICQCKAGLYKEARFQRTFGLITNPEPTIGLGQQQITFT